MNNEHYISNSGEIENLKKNFEKLVEDYKYYPSTLSYYRDLFRKILVISSASFFEKEITKFIGEQIRNSNTKKIINHFSQKCIERKYDSWFNFKDDKRSIGNIFQGFSFFGEEDIREKLKNKIKEDRQEENLLRFLKIGYIRNKIIHSDFISSDINAIVGEITFEEFYRYHEDAIKGWNFLMQEISKFSD